MKNLELRLNYLEKLIKEIHAEIVKPKKSAREMDRGFIERLQARTRAEIEARDLEDEELFGREKSVLEVMRRRPDDSFKSSVIAIIYLKVSKSEVLRALNGLIEKGYVEREGRHTFTKYFLTAKGKQ